MAKKKTPKKSLKKTVRKTARPAKRKAAPKRPPAAGPRAVTTGRGPGAVDVARQFVDLLAASRFDDLENQWLAPGLESVEGAGVAMAWQGKKNVLAKYRAWEADHEIHQSRIEGPWVGATGFCLKWTIDVTQKSTGQRHQMEEIAVYTVQNGKVAREEFHYKVE